MGLIAGRLRVFVLWHLIHEAPSLGEQELRLTVVGLIDAVTIFNRRMTMAVGGCET